MRRSLGLFSLLVGCTGGMLDGTMNDSLDGGAADLATPAPDLATAAAPDLGAPSGIAPTGTVPGEVAAKDGENAVMVTAAMDAVLRVDAQPGQHVAFELTFSSSVKGVDMTVERWDKGGAVALGTTDAGPGLRVLAVVDQGGPRTFWVRVSSDTTSFSGMLQVTRTPFVDAAKCSSDCARLLQMPLPNDPTVDGYDHDSGTIFRYWFGRRDLVMMVRAAGRQLAADGRKPMHPYDFSQWDGLTPGSDTGSLRHASHQRGKDVDISLVGTDGQCIWRSFCTTHSTSDGRECVPGTIKGFDGPWNARLFAPFYETGRVTMCFLDRELIPAAAAGAKVANMSGFVDASILPLYSDGKHLQHWPNHDNHIHVRVSEATDTGGAGPTIGDDEPFEAP